MAERKPQHRHPQGEFRPVKRPGAATKQAKREGLSLGAWARKHAHDSGPRGSKSLRVGQEARFIEARKSWHPHTGPRKPKRAAGSRHSTVRRSR